VRSLRHSLLILGLLALATPALADTASQVAAVDSNSVMLMQNGDHNVIVVRQFGDGSSAIIRQTGGNNRACLTQIGNDRTFEFSQSGGARISLMQTPGHTHAIPLQACLSMHGGRRPAR
jgi:hypothetical protein